MHPTLAADFAQLDTLLAAARETALAHLAALDSHPAGRAATPRVLRDLPAEGAGAGRVAVDRFRGAGRDV